MSKIFLSVPILDRPELKMMYSMYQAILTCPQHQIRLYLNSQDSLISRVRNVHMSVFLHEFPECDYFMSFDSDIEIVNCYPNNNIFKKLIEHDLDFVGGLYATKNPKERRCSSITMDSKVPLFNSGLKEIRWLSSGCWCLKRSAVEKMVKAYPELDYEGDDNAAGKIIHGLYIPMIYNMTKEEFPTLEKDTRKYLSEDWSFAQRWRQIGGKIFADTSIFLRHIGKKDYTVWDVEAVTTTKPKPPEPGFDLKLEK